MLRSGGAFVRPTELERSFGRLMRSPEGHDAGSGGAAAGAVADAGAGGAAEGAADTSALGGADAGGEGGAASGDQGGGQSGDGKTGADGAAAGDGKGAEGGEAEGGVPEAYELAAPEGTTIDPADLAAATPVFKELGLSNEQANKLIPIAAGFGQRIADQINNKIVSDVQAERKSWLDTAQADPEIGGANWKKSLADGAAALDRLGFPKGAPFRELLDASGLGNHPEMIRAWAKVGQAIGDDPKFLRGNGAGAPKRDAAETLYPDDKPKTGGQ